MQMDNQLLPEIGDTYRKEFTKMDNVNVLNQMAEYDFNSPINVTMIFEDSDEEIDTSFENIREQENIQADTNNKETSGKECALECLQVNKKNCKPLKKNNKMTKNKTKISKNILGKIINNNSSLENIRKNFSHVEEQNNVNKSVSGLHSCILRNEVRENTESNENTVHTFVEDLLDKLSENLLMIMQSFYYYDTKRRGSSAPVVDVIKLDKTFRFIKSHFFEVSYTTVETVILPLEQNSALINQFLDNTMMIAEIKFPKLNFQKDHMRALLNELLVWSKQKQAHFKTIKQTPNRNFNLREHLTRPPQPPPYPNNIQNLANVSAPSVITQNDMWCIFRSGAPGSQISINVNPDTLLSCTKKQKTNNTVEITGNRNTFATSGQYPTRNTSVAPPPYNSHSYYHQSSPHLNQNQTIHPSQNRCNIEQHYRNRQNTGHAIQSYRTQDFRNPLRYDCINLTNEMHETESEPEPRPVITNVTSLCPKTYTSVRCCMCGKMSEQTYYGHSHSNTRPTYCSNLCQELDIQVRNSLCNST